MLAKYYARLIVVGFIIFILISQHYVDPLGLLVGLSVVVASIILATFREVAKMGFSGEDIYYCGLVVSMVLSVFLGLTLGLFLDRHVFHTAPRFTLVFLVFGIIIGFRSIGVVIKKIRKF